MGGTSKQAQTQESTSNPWAPAQPLLEGILGQLGGQLNNTALTGAETGALNQLQDSANAGNPYAGQIGSYANNLLNGGGANAQAGAVQGGYDALNNRLGGMADVNYSSLNDPKLRAALDQIQTDVGSSVNSQFAAAGRDMSGANQMAYGRGVSAAQTPLVLNQFNQDRSLQQGAANTLYGAQNQTSGILAGMNQQGLANKSQGVTTAGAALDASNYGANANLAIEAQRRGIPMQQLGLLAQLGIPIAGLGGQKSGSSSGSYTMSGVDQFSKIAGGISSIGSMFSGGGGTPAGNILKMFSDARMKTDIAMVGALNDGTPVYRFRYIGQPAFQIGLMAQDVEKTTPEAVAEIHGFKAVDYKIATDNSLKAA